MGKHYERIGKELWIRESRGEIHRRGESYSRMVLRTKMLGDSETMNFTLDSSGEWEKSNTYATVGSHVEACGTIVAPGEFADGTNATWNVKVESSVSPEYKKEYDDVATGASVDYSIPTNFGDTKITIKIWSSRGSEDAGVQGSLEMSD